MDELDELRKNQLVRSEDPVQNFSVMATALVIVVSLIVVIMGMMLPCCVKARRDRDRKRGVLSASAARKDLARRADDRFQWLRMALEATAIRVWEEGLWGVPGVGSEARIGGLKVAEPVMDNLLVRYPNDSKGARSFRSSRKKSIETLEGRDEKKPAGTVETIDIGDEKCST